MPERFAARRQMKRKLRLGYFAPLNSIHTVRWLDHFCSLGHEVFVFKNLHSGFIRWNEKSSADIVGSSFKNPPDEDISQASIGITRLKSVYNRIPVLNVLLDIAKRRRWVLYHTAKIQPDIVHTLWLGERAFDMFLAGVHPMGVTLWGSDIRKMNETPRLKSLKMQIALRNADLVTADSHELLEISQEKGAKAGKCHLIGVPGIDVTNFSNPKRDGELFKDFGIPDGAKVILSCRAVQPLYQTHNIVDAFQHVYQEIPDAFLLIINYNSLPEYLTRIKEQISQSGLEKNILIVDMVSYQQMPELYAGSRVMVSIPQTDGMPQSVYEAMAAGCPVVVSDLSTYNGVVEHNKTGLRVPGDQPVQIAKAILRVLKENELCHNLIAQGRALMQERGDIFQEMSKMEQLYFDLLK